jgi:hypothetical protein
LALVLEQKHNFNHNDFKYLYTPNAILWSPCSEIFKKTAAHFTGDHDFNLKATVLMGSKLCLGGQSHLAAAVAMKQSYTNMYV